MRNSIAPVSLWMRGLDVKVSWRQFFLAGKATVYRDESIHKAPRMKADEMSQSMSELVDDALKTGFCQLLLAAGAPIFFFVVLFSEFGMFVLKDGREFGFPLWGRAYPNAADFLGTYVVLGASYLAARKATRMPLRPVRIIGWIEVVGFASLRTFELFLLIRRVFVA